MVSSTDDAICAEHRPRRLRFTRSARKLFMYHGVSSSCSLSRVRSLALTLSGSLAPTSAVELSMASDQEGPQVL